MGSGSSNVSPEDKARIQQKTKSKNFPYNFLKSAW